jgi:hypothetical protein
MAPTPTTYRAQRPLTRPELDSVLAAIGTAGSIPQLLGTVLTSVFTALLRPLGDTLDSYGPGHHLNPAAFAIPATQWTAISEAAMARADALGGRMGLAMDLVNHMPATYDDPSAPVPDTPPPDQRPREHVLTVTREAADVIAAATRHCARLATYFGEDSREYREATGSWQHNLSQVFSLAFGAQTRIVPDDDLSLLVSTASGFTFAIIFHRQPRRCTNDGCTAVIDDDGTARTPWPDAPACPAGQHAPCYPLDAPHPGSWSFHS